LSKIDKTTISIPLAGPLNEALDPEMLPLGTTFASSNYIHDKVNQISKRAGFSSLNGSNTLDNPVALMTYKDQLLALDNNGINTYSETLGTFNTCLGLLIPVDVTTTPVSNPLGSWTSAVIDSAINGNILLEVYETMAPVTYTASYQPNGVYYSLTDLTTNSKLCADVKIGLTQGTFRVLSSGGYLYIVGQISRGNNENLDIYTFNASSPLSPTVTTISTSSIFDGGALAYSQTPGAILITAYYGSATKIIKFNAGTYSVVATVPFQSVLVAKGIDDRYWHFIHYKYIGVGNYHICWTCLDSTNWSTVKNDVQIEADTGVGFTNPIGICSDIHSTGDTVQFIWNEAYAGTGGSYKYVRTVTCNLTDGWGSVTTLCNNVSIISKIFTNNGANYLTVLYTSAVSGIVSTEQTYFVINLADGKPVARFLSGSALDDKYVSAKGLPLPCNVSSNGSINIQGNGTLTVTGEGFGGIETSPDGTTWTARTSSFGLNSVYGVAYGNGLWVVGGGQGIIETSPDGITWTARTNHGFGTNNIDSITYGNGFFVAVGGNGSIETSTDGINWVTRSNSFSGNTVYSAAYGNGQWVAVGAAGNIETSPDGIVWTTRSNHSFGTNNIRSVTYGNGLFVAVGYAGNIETSTDGINWVAQTNHEFGTYNIRGIAYANGLFIAVGSAGNIETSTDGINWIARLNGFSTNAIYGVAYNGQSWIAVGAAGNIETSPDGINWTTRSGSIGNDIFVVGCLSSSNTGTGLKNNGYTLFVPAIYAEGSAALSAGTYSPTPCRVDLEFSIRPSLVEAGQNLLISTGGMVWDFDGSIATEKNFNLYPEITGLVGTTGAVGGFFGQLSNGTYEVQITFEYFDSNNTRHQSSPSVPATITLSGGGSAQAIQVYYANPSMSRKNCTVYAYCTLAGQTTLYEASVITATDTTPEGTICIYKVANTSPYIYTTGGISRAIAPLGFKSVTRYGDRIFGYAGNDTIWYSKQYTTGYAIEFTDRNTMFIDVDPGVDLELVEQDGAVYVLSENSIQWFQGTPNDDTGNGGNIALPARIASSTGRQPHTPVLKTEEGIFFLGSRGMYLLQRDGRTLTPKGLPIEDTVATVTINSAVISYDKYEIRFTTLEGNNLVLNFKEDKWTVLSGLPALDSCIWQEHYILLTSAGNIWYEDPTSIADCGTLITSSITTPWIKLNGLQGFQRLHHLGLKGNTYSASGLTMNISYDYSKTPTETVVVDTLTGFANDGSFQVRHHIGKACEAIQLNLTETCSGYFTLNELELEISQKQGIYRRLGKNY